jgi:hypothetical protein
VGVERRDLLKEGLKTNIFVLELFGCRVDEEEKESKGSAVDYIDFRSRTANGP